MDRDELTAVKKNLEAQKISVSESLIIETWSYVGSSSFVATSYLSSCYSSFAATSSSTFWTKWPISPAFKVTGSSSVAATSSSTLTFSSTGASCYSSFVASSSSTYYFWNSPILAIMLLASVTSTTGSSTRESAKDR